MVEEAVFECVGEGAVGVAGANGGVGAVVDRDEGLDTTHAGAALVILRVKGEGAVKGVLRVQRGMERGGGRHCIEGVAPYVGADGRVVVEHDECLCAHGVAGMHAAVRQDVEVDVSLAVA